MSVGRKPGGSPASANSALDTRAYGEFPAKPQTEFRGATFYALTQDDVHYFHLLIDSIVLDTVLHLQDWIFDRRPSYRQLAYDLAHKNTIAAWALTALTQTDRTARRCCFLHMALAYKEPPPVK